MKPISLIATLVAYFGLWPMKCGAADTPNAAHQEQVAVLVAEVCTECHNLEPIRRTVNCRGGWEQTVKEMVVRGAQLKSEDIFRVTQFLAESYGPGGNPMRTILVPTPGGVAPSHPMPAQCNFPTAKGRNNFRLPVLRVMTLEGLFPPGAARRNGDITSRPCSRASTVPLPLKTWQWLLPTCASILGVMIGPLVLMQIRQCKPGAVVAL
jgi:hypothetical protein